MPFSSREIVRSIAAGEFQLMFQPMVRARSRQVHGAEALIRWQHPRRGYLGPASFLPSLERTNTMAALTHWTIDSALDTCARWAADGVNVPVSVNLSATLVDKTWIVDAALDSLAKHGLAPGLLTLEVTETALAEHPQSASQTLARLRSAGVHVSLDDFGTGYTSLALLKSHVFDEIKIDRSFVTSMRHSPADAAIVRSILELGHRLGSRVVAEGIEDVGTARMLEDLGCDVLQGYLFAKPLSPQDAERYLRSHLAPPDGTPHELRYDTERPPTTAMDVHRAVVDLGLSGSEPVRSDAYDVDDDRLRELADMRILQAPPSPVLDDIVEVARDLCGTESALISVINAERLWFAARTTVDDVTDEVFAREPERDHVHALCAHAILEPTEIMHITDASLDPRFVDNPYVTGPPHLRFYAGVPLTSADGDAFGTLCVIDSQARTLSDAQLSTLRRLSRIAVRHMETARSEAVMRRLRDLTGHLASMRSSADLPDVASAVADTAADVLGAAGAVLFTPESPGAVRYRPIGISTRVHGKSSGVAGAVVDSRDDDVVSRAIRAGEPVMTNLGEQGAGARGVLDRGDAASALCVPIHDAGSSQVNGVLVSWWRSVRLELSTVDRSAIGILADEAGTTLHRLETLARLQASVQLDPLTGLLNRGAFVDRARTAIDDGVLVLFELEHLHSVNEQYDRCTGDRLLKAFAAHVRAAARAGDLVARWSGRCFVVARAGAGTEDARHLLDELAQSWTDNLIDFRGGYASTTRSESITTSLARAQTTLQRERICVDN